MVYIIYTWWTFHDHVGLPAGNYDFLNRFGEFGEVWVMKGSETANSNRFRTGTTKVVSMDQQTNKCCHS